MNGFGRLIFVLIASFFGATAIAADFDGSKPLMCSFAQITECDAGDECFPVTNDGVDAPDFVKFNFKKKHVIAISAGVETAPDDLDSVKNLVDYLVIQGVQGGAEDAAKNTLAWSATISHESGAIVVAAAGENAGFVVFGACTPI